LKGVQTRVTTLPKLVGEGKEKKKKDYSEMKVIISDRKKVF